MFVVYEQTSYWVAALRWALTGYGIRVVEANSWVDCERELESSPASVLGLELRHDNVVEAVEAILRWRDQFPDARVLVFASRELRDAFGLLYEAGAVHVAESIRNLDATARVVDRLLGRVVHYHRDYRQQVLDRLPW